MKKFYLFILLGFACMAVKSQTVQILKHGGFSNATNITEFNGKLYFYGDFNNDISGLLSSDGISPTVTLIKETSGIDFFTVLNNLLVFTDYNQLWKSDGTSEGTSVFKTIRQPPHLQFVVMNNKMYFAGDESNSSPAKDQLWVTDGTASSTKLVKTINPSGVSAIDQMKVIGNQFYFSAFDGTGSYNVPWISDGTEAGTRKIKEIVSKVGANASYFTSYNGKVYFTAYEDNAGVQIWVTDGTTDGTKRITNFNTAQNGYLKGYGYNPFPFTLFNSKLFFCAPDSTGSQQLWSTDGTAPGTKIIKKLNTGLLNSGFYPVYLTVFNQKLYMGANDSIAGPQLFASDGTTAGTVRISNTDNFSPSHLYIFQNKLIMFASGGTYDKTGIWVSDGTTAGTVFPNQLLVDNQTFMHWMAWVPFNNSLYYRAAYRYWQWYDLCRFTLDSSTGLPELSQQNLSVYPNPSNGNFNVVLPPSTLNASIEVYNSTGTLISKQTATNAVNTVDLSIQSPGLYLLKVICNNRVIDSQKIILSIGNH